MLSLPLISFISLPAYWEPKHYHKRCTLPIFVVLLQHQEQYVVTYFACFDIYINDMKLYASFCNLLFSFSILFVKSIHIDTCSPSLFILITVHGCDKIPFLDLLSHLGHLEQSQRSLCLLVLPLPLVKVISWVMLDKLNDLSKTPFAHL